ETRHFSPSSPQGRRQRARRRWPNPATRIRYRPIVEWIECRTLLSTFSVTSAGDSGPGTLRQAILDAESSSSRDTITFAIPGAGVQTISLASELPTISESVLIDGWSQPGYAGTPLIELRGTSALSHGLQITGADVQVRGLAIDGFS